MTHLTFLLLEGGVWPRLGITMNCLAAITPPQPQKQGSIMETDKVEGTRLKSEPTEEKNHFLGTAKSYVRAQSAQRVV
jgi:hypothetical protein